MRPYIVCFFGFLIPLLNSTFYTYSYGIFIFSLILHVEYRLNFSRLQLIYAPIIFLVIFIQVLITSGLNFKSLASSIVLIYCSMIFFNFGSRLSSKNINNEYKVYLTFFLAVCCISILSYTFKVYFGYNFIYQGPKPCFPFEEPSHFALFIGPILIGFSANTTSNIRFIFPLFLLIFTIFFQSLVFLAFCITSFFLNIKHPRSLIRKFLIVLAGCPAIYLMDNLIIDGYISQRLLHLLNPNTINMSALVYFQGWNSIYESLANHSFGIGFQFLGHEPPNFYNLRIYELSGAFVNRQDGGFLFAKFISELGTLGLLIFSCLILYIYFIIKRAVDFKLLNLKAASFMIFSLAVPLLFRDVGYFSYTLFYFFSSIGFLVSSTNYKVDQK